MEKSDKARFSKKVGPLDLRTPLNFKIFKAPRFFGPNFLAPLPLKWGEGLLPWCVFVSVCVIVCVIVRVIV